MPLINTWSGNVTSDLSLSDKSLIDLYNFYSYHKQNYIYGNGKIGSGLNHYLQQSNIPAVGFVTTETIEAFRKQYQKGETGIIMGLSDIYYPEVMSILSSFVDEGDIFALPSEIRETFGRQFSLAYIEDNFWLNIFVTNQCNLNCKSCSTFAPICSPDFYKFDEFCEDLEQFYKLGIKTVTTLKFTGGEPLLHPRLLDMFEYARKFFANIPFECYTNGLLLNKLTETDIIRLKNIDVNFVVTEYPLSNLCLDSFFLLADKHFLNYKIIYSEEQKYFSKRPLNFSKQTPEYMFANCPRYRICDSLFLFKRGLYKCIYTFASAYFNEAFGTSLQIERGDYLDVYNTSAKQIYEFCRTRLPFCGYCKPITEIVSWELSERSISEWT